MNQLSLRTLAKHSLMHCERTRSNLVFLRPVWKRNSTYILTNKGHNVLYTGVTNDLKRRVFEHKQDVVGGFTKKYRVHKLVHYEIADDAYSAISREKQIKGGSRADKLKPVNGSNREWRDLYEQL